MWVCCDVVVVSGFHSFCSTFSFLFVFIFYVGCVCLLLSGLFPDFV